LDQIDFDLDLSVLRMELAREGGAMDEEVLRGLTEEARSIARPKAGYRVSQIDEKGVDDVVIDGIWIRSRVLRQNLDQVQRVFPFLATCGWEIEDWAGSRQDDLRRVWAKRISELALRSAVRALVDHIQTHFHTGPTAKVNPGSTIDWPLLGQKDLFQLLDEVAERIGVILTGDLWMSPTMSTSGIRYPSEVTFVNCSLCPMESCRLRKAPYQEGLYERKYQ
jgi:hypothetical protein